MRIRRCQISRIYRLAISIIATIASMAMFIRRARFPIRRRYSESALFFSLLPFLSRWSMRATFLSARSFSMWNYRALGDLLSFAFVDSPRLSARIINDRPLRAWWCSRASVAHARPFCSEMDGPRARARLPSNYRYLRCQNLSFEPAALNFQSPSLLSRKYII